jgi:hypothetical protein
MFRSALLVLGNDRRYAAVPITWIKSRGLCAKALPLTPSHISLAPTIFPASTRTGPKQNRRNETPELVP